jgi:dienelactone hydrolase
MTTRLIEIATPDGPCKTELFVPDGNGPWPAVLVFFDAGGLRAAQTRIAERIARSGYVVAQPDLFHRAPPISTMLGGEEVTLKGMMKVFQDPDLRAKSIKSRVYLGPATGDLPADAEAKLRGELDAGHVRYQIEHYDANHGYAVDDSEAYNEAAAEKHYAALDALFAAALRG